MKKLILGLGAAWLLVVCPARAQRVYRDHSILSSGTWYKLGVTAPGVYRIDASLLQKMGMAGLPPAAYRLFGNGGSMVPEDNKTPRPDDLQEVAIQAGDGGSLLFYAAGPHTWTVDSVSRTFHHQKNLYTDTAYYFLSATVGGSGLRIGTQVATAGPTEQVTVYQDHVYHELDSLNFLASGKAWYGEEMADMPGSTTRLDFNPVVPGLAGGGTIFLTTDVLARSIGTPGVVTVRVDDSLLQTLTIQPTTNGAYDIFAYETSQQSLVPANPDSLHLRLDFSSQALDAQAWLGWWEMILPRKLDFEGAGQFGFRDWNSVGARQVAGFTITGATPGDEVWDVTNPQAPVQMQTAVSGAQMTFTASADRLREYVAFTENGTLVPAVIGSVSNQDLHGTGPADLLVVTHPSLLPQAQRLAAFHQTHDSLRVQVVTTTQVFDEFSSGSPDPTAIRDFAKMYYDRAGADSTKRPRYLLLFGDASYDYKHRIPGNDNLVPCYESVNSLDPLNTYTSDDFFGFLRDADNINDPTQTPLLDMGIGRIPAGVPADAQHGVDKVVAYNTSQTLGAWRTEMTFVADDGDQNLHLQDAESISGTVGVVAPQDHLDKIYLDAYPEQAGSGGGRYPEVVTAINEEMYTGTLVMNYNGHGGNTRLSNEDILDATTVSAWANGSHLPLLITATCNFAPYDDPQVQSLGERVVLQPQTGAIALMTTTRDVFAFSNLIMNTNYMQAALQTTQGGRWPSLGDAVRLGKNNTYLTYADVVNNRKFTLIGDPALTLALPKVQPAALTAGGRPVRQDTLKALNKYTMTGQLAPSFNGTAYITVYDKPAATKTRGNNAGSLVTTFTQLSSILYKGKATVTGGKFQATFVVPKDIDYTLGYGKVMYYAENGTTDVCGADSVLVGGTGSAISNDHTGPVIKAYLNDDQFVNGSITNQTPTLLLNLFDSSGINTTGTGIGHDLTAILDGNGSNPYVLNRFYEAAANSYQSGTVQFPLPTLTPGFHTLLIKVWDVADNVSEVTLAFVVEGDSKLVLSHVLNYPNPFTTHTQIWFEHNQPGQPLEVMVRILTITGKIIKTIRKTIISTGNRSSSDLDWDGRDEFGNKLGKGVYLFELQVRTANGQTANAINKMVLL
ncbi:MAG TPA: type IX secretion system sortase PorU [Dinghuibacter sp.]|uniref:type IX secretion system sortase PorU n=1 Tax=Dinghuibacter sp. TaxID=2024697 RepID=UPI002B9FC01D|nr:type IX secretion system sortase PorU [Dinghuibacter sp.]HTJ14392.1 type IX secretion system sortase PorU [Dinghuibacter sp.]